MSEEKQEVVLPRRVLPQPQPAIYPGGDCGPCVLAGLLGSPSVASATAWLETSPDPIPPPLSWLCMRQALDRALRHGALDRLVSEDLPRWGRSDLLSIWGEPSYTQALPWFGWIRMALDGGYYAVCCVDSARRGPVSGEKVVDGDHWVMLVGARERLVPTALSGCQRVVQELLVSNSSRSAEPEEWVDAWEFLARWGGYNALLARPARVGSVPGGRHD